MAQLIIDIPDAQIERVKDAFATHFSWDGQGSKAAFVKKMTANWIKQIVKDEEIKQAQLAAANTVQPVDPS